VIPLSDTAVLSSAVSRKIEEESDAVPIEGFFPAAEEEFFPSAEPPPSRGADPAATSVLAPPAAGAIHRRTVVSFSASAPREGQAPPETAAWFPMTVFDHTVAAGVPWMRAVFAPFPAAVFAPKKALVPSAGAVVYCPTAARFLSADAAGRVFSNHNKNQDG